MYSRWIFLGIGFVAGGIGGFVIGNSACNKELKKAVQRLERERDKLATKLRRLVEKDMDKREEDVKKQYDNLVKDAGYSQDEDEEDVEDDESEDEEEEDDDPFIEEGQNGFKLLTKEQYDEDITIVSSTEHLMFYQEDGILVDEFDDMIPNCTETIGQEAFKECGNTREDFVYVRNDYDDIWYEIEINRTDSFYRDTARR